MENSNSSGAFSETNRLRDLGTQLTKTGLLSRFPLSQVNSDKESLLFQLTSTGPATHDFLSKSISKFRFNNDGLMGKLGQITGNCDRVLMVVEDFRAFELRKNGHREVLNRNRRWGYGCVEVSCSLSELYMAFNDFSRVISFVEDDGAGSFVVPIGDAVLELNVQKSDLDFENKGKVVRENIVFHQGNTGTEGREVTEEFDLNEFLGELRESMKTSYSELQEISRQSHCESFEISHENEKMARIEHAQLRTAQYTQNELLKQLEWQSTELSAIKKCYQEKADQLAQKSRSTGPKKLESRTI